MAGLFDLMRGLRGAPSNPEQIAEMDRVRRWRESLMQALVPPKVSDEEIARAMEYRKSVMRDYQGPQVPLTPEQTEADRLAGWEAAVGYSPQDVRGGMKGRRESEGALNRAMEWASLAPFGATVFHGSPHRFEKFDLSKTGTGEGTQSRGFGVYVAENPQVAASYKLTGPGTPGVAITPEVRAALNEMDDLGFDSAGQALGHLRTIADWKKVTDLRGVSQQAIDTVDEFMKKNPRGNLYKVDLPDSEIAKMLDWEKPLKEQPEVLKKVFEHGWQHRLSPIHGFKNTGDFTGTDLVRTIGMGKDGAAQLLEAGIPGVRHLTQTALAGGKPDYNMVVFDPELLKILERE